MDVGQIALYVWLIGWVAFAIIGFMLKKSAVISLGGGFIAGCFLLVLLIPIFERVETAIGAKNGAVPMEPLRGEVTVTLQSTEPQEEINIRSSIDAFKKQCKPLIDAWEDVASSSAKAMEPYPYQIERGWRWQTEIKVRLKNEQQKIPAGFRSNGHTCRFLVNTETQPAMYVAKEPCQRLCVLPRGTELVELLK